jgi:xylulokinase
MGERSPVNNPYLRGQFFNLGMYTTRADMLRSIFEGVAFNLEWGIQIVQKLSKKRQDHIRIIGGASQSDIWCQIFADVWQKKVIRMQNPQQASAIGAACIAMVGLGIFKDFSSISQMTHVDKEFLPDSKGILEYNNLLKVYQQLSSKNNSLFKQLNAHTSQKKSE